MFGVPLFCPDGRVSVCGVFWKAAGVLDVVGVELGESVLCGLICRVVVEAFSSGDVALQRVPWKRPMGQRNRRGFYGNFSVLSRSFRRLRLSRTRTGYCSPIGEPVSRF